MAPSKLESLPAEIRINIFRHLLRDSFIKVSNCGPPPVEVEVNIHYEILLICKSLKIEAEPILCSNLRISFEDDTGPNDLPATPRAKYLPYVNMMNG